MDLLSLILAVEILLRVFGLPSILLFGFVLVECIRVPFCDLHLKTLTKDPPNLIMT